jgi:serine/threonine-protein kinase
MEVCKGLEHAHTKRDASGRHLQIVHRDLSPPNILVSRAGEVKITDFGLAKATSQLSKTDPGVVKGKYSYLSPEVTDGKPADHRADIFAAGIVLWELLANRRLFYGRTETETVDLVRQADVPPLSRFNPEVKPELMQIIQRALARDPRKRFTSAREFGEALADFLARNALRATSFDLAQMLERLFGTEGVDGQKSEDAVQRQKRIGAMIEEEIANLSMAGHSSATRNLVGRDPIDPNKLALGALNSPIFDLSATWSAGGAPRALVKARQAPPPSLRTFQEVGDIESMTRLLEGCTLAELELPTTRATTAPKKPVWLYIAIAVAVIGGGVAAALL